MMASRGRRVSSLQGLHSLRGYPPERLPMPQQMALQTHIYVAQRVLNEFFFLMHMKLGNKRVWGLGKSWREGKGGKVDQMHCIYE